MVTYFAIVIVGLMFATIFVMYTSLCPIAAYMHIILVTYNY